MKRTLLMGLGLTFVALLCHAAFDRPIRASGEVLCRQMTGCTSPNLCENGILDVDECRMSCLGGGTVYCEKIIIE